MSDGESHSERGAFVQLAFDGYFTTQRLDSGLTEAEAKTIAWLGSTSISSVESIKNEIQLTRFNTNARVCNA